MVSHLNERDRTFIINKDDIKVYLIDLEIVRF